MAMEQLVALPRNVDELSDDEPGLARGLGRVVEVDALSDDDAAPPLPAPARVEARQRVSKQKRQPSREEFLAQVNQRLLQVVKTRCTCRNPDCRRPRKEDATKLEKLFKTRTRLLDLPKLEADEEATCQCQAFVIPKGNIKLQGDAHQRHFGRLGYIEVHS